MKISTTWASLVLALTALGTTAQEAVTLPYEITFNNKTAADTWAMINANNDGYKWEYGSRGYSLGVYSSVKDHADDWTISPAIELKKGSQYEITYYLHTYSSGYTQTMAFYVVNSRTEVDANPQEIVSFSVTTSDSRGTSASTKFTSETDGIAYIGLHVNSPSNSGQLIFRDFSISELGSAAAPGEVTEYTVTPGANGALTATIAFKAPAIDATGGEMSGNVKVKAYREEDAEPFFTTEDLTPGQATTITDNEALDGETFYRLVATNDSGDSQGVTVETYIGVDTPVEVSNLTLSVEGNNVEIGWTAPTASVHGGYIDFSTVTYTINRVINDELQTIAQGINETAYTDESLPGNTQVNVSYQVIGRTSAGLGRSVQSRIVNAGPATALPLKESFSESAYQTAPWRQEVVTSFEDKQLPAWELIESATITTDATDDNPEGITINITSQDTDRGLIRFNSNRCGQWSRVGIGRLIFPAIDLTNASNPVLKFYIFRETYYSVNPANNPVNIDDQVKIEVSTDNGEFSLVPDAVFHRYGTANDWELCEVPLYQYIGQERVNVSLTGYGCAGGPIYIDNISIEDGIAHDLQVVSLSGPSRVRVGERGTYTVAVKNAGGRTTDGYAIEMYRNESLIETIQGSQLKPGKTELKQFIFTPDIELAGNTYEISAQVVYEQDQEPGNNRSEAISTAIVDPLLPAVSTLKATTSGAEVKLTWNKPDYISSESLLEEDSFEDYEPFAIANIGEYTLYDLDNRITFGIGSSAGVTYPNSGEKIAFQVFNPWMTNIDEEEIALWAPHSGQNMLIAPQAMSGSESTTSNDWLVFPRLSGNAHNILFYARGVNDNYKESMQAFYSNLNNPTEADDFLPCGDEGATNYFISSEWKQYRYQVPAGAKWFALRHTSADGYAFMLDDVTYERSIPTPESVGHIGYNIYCNDVQVNDEIIAPSAKEYTYSAQTGEYTYTIVAVYSEGNSMKSNEVNVRIEGTGIDGTTTAESAPVYYNLQGMRVENPVAGTIYIVRRGTTVNKELYR